MNNIRPAVDEHLAADLAKRWGLEGQFKELGSYDGRNFLVSGPDGRRHILKFSGSIEAPEAIDLQNRALKWLSERPSGPLVPRVIATLRGEDIVSVNDAQGRPTLARVLSWLEGEMWADLGIPTAKQQAEFGLGLGRLVRDFEGFKHPATDRPFYWNLVQAEWIAEQAGIFQGDAERAAHIGEATEAFLTRIKPRLSELPWQTIHGDANHHNVLFQGDKLTGFIDFGDVCRAPVVCELAIALAYALMFIPNPQTVIETAAGITGAFHRVSPLSGLEVELLFDLIRARLAVCLTYSTLESARDPGNAHVSVSQRPGWVLLGQLGEIGRSGFREAVAEACASCNPSS